MQQQRRDFHLDRISLLPDSILTSILSFLSIKEAARTSVLSQRWKLLWLSIPSLNLDESLGFTAAFLAERPRRFTSDKFDPKRWFSSTTHILLARSRFHHHHPILRCRIRFNRFTENNFLFDSFLLFLCSNGIKTLSLWNRDAVCYHIPIHIYFCSSLQSLTLHKCVVRLPNKFAGWHALKTITFSLSIISDSDLVLIMSLCGALESLCLNDCDGHKKIVVRAPKLLALTVYNDNVISISLETAPNIVDFSLSLSCLMQSIDVEHDGYNLFELLMNIPRVEYLNLYCHEDIEEVVNIVFSEQLLYCDLFSYSLLFYYVKYQVPLVKERIQLPQCLPSNHLLRNLRTLYLSLCLTDADLIPILSCLLSSSPNLHELVINDDPYGAKSKMDGAYWDGQQVTDCMKHQLSSVNLSHVNLNYESAVNFIKFLLMNAHALKRMTVSYNNLSEEPLLVEDELRSTKWASHHAVLEFHLDL